MISFIICANSRWKDYATDFIRSIRQFEPEVECILVDNGSPEPYKPGDYRLLRLEANGDYNYMKALNAGARLAIGDWLVFCNDDILCKGKFKVEMEKLPVDAVSGFEIRQKDKKWGFEFQYLYGWMLIIPRNVWESVGTFDEYYLHAGFDDLDYSWRAQRKGFALRTVDLPFIHLADQPGYSHRRVTVPNYQEMMKRSKLHFMNKVK